MFYNFKRNNTIYPGGTMTGKRIIKTSFAYFLVFLIVSCVTINIYFPAAAVEKAADKIVDEVWGDEGSNEDLRDKPQSLLDLSIRYVLSVIGPGEAHAQEPDVNVTTPAIRALKKSIRDRADSIKPYMDRGSAGISSEGLIALRSKEGLSLKEKAQLNRIIKAENRDREALYLEIAKANNFPPDRVADIKEIFARSWIKQARKGWWIQGPDGSWSQK
jgi:uncharacterized protein YdbL (DUF1318 family)